MTEAEVTVTIKDVNDEAPQFSQRDVQVVINENVKDGTPLPNLDISVTDTDVVSPHNNLSLIISAHF